MPLPTLAVVSGPPGGFGKTTLAHRIAPLLGCPAICRDEIKEGMVHATPGYQAQPGDDLTWRTLATFFDVVGTLVRAGVTVVAEAAFQDRLWRPQLEPLMEHARIRVIRCTVDPAAAHSRAQARDGQNHRRAAHVRRTEDQPPPDVSGFVPISLPVPTLQVDTSDGYTPGLPEIVAFLEASR